MLPGWACCWYLRLVPRARRKSTSFCLRSIPITRSVRHFASGSRRRRRAKTVLPVTAEIGPSLDFSVKSPLKFADVTAFDLDDSKSRVAGSFCRIPISAYPQRASHEPLLTLLHLELSTARVRFLLSDRNRADLNWRGGGFTWRYRNRIQLERTSEARVLPPSALRQRRVLLQQPIRQMERHRALLRLLFPLRSSHFEFNPYYEHQNNTGNSPNQQYNQLGLMLNMYFSRR